jgi:hypothetical protein
VNWGTAGLDPGLCSWRDDQKAQEERSRRTAITSDRVLEEIARIAFADPASWEKLPHKLSAKVQALVLAARHLGLLNDKLQVDQRSVTSSEAAELYRRLANAPQYGQLKDCLSIAGEMCFAGITGISRTANGE